MSVQYVETGGAEGDFHYCASIKPEGVVFAGGKAADPLFVMTMDEPTAISMSKQETSVQKAWMIRRLVIEGPLLKLVTVRKPLEALAEAITPVVGRFFADP